MGPADATPENTLQTLQHPSQALDVTGNERCLYLAFNCSKAPCTQML